MRAEAAEPTSPPSTMDEKFRFQSDTYILFHNNYDNKMEFSKHGSIFFNQAKVCKVFNLDIQFFFV